MKRLLDEPGDQVTWLLIRAGANQQPPRTGKLRLLAALGLGSALWLSAREVLAWLGTGSGKVALAVTVLGASAGGVYALAGTARDESTRAAPSVPAVVGKAPLEVLPAAPPAVSAEVDRAPPTLLEPSQSPPPAATARPRAARPRPARPPEPARAEAAPPRDAAPGPALSRRRLTEETLWVDRLRVAAERGDRADFSRLEQGYAEQFPDGQLRPEVNRLRDSF